MVSLARKSPEEQLQQQGLHSSFQLELEAGRLPTAEGAGRIRVLPLPSSPGTSSHSPLLPSAGTGASFRSLMTHLQAPLSSCADCVPSPCLALRVPLPSHEICFRVLHNARRQEINESLNRVLLNSRQFRRGASNLKRLRTTVFETPNNTSSQ